MNYKGILTEDTATHFKKEGATFVLISIFKDGELIRDLEVRLEDEEKVFCIAGKSGRAQAGLAKEFVKTELGGRDWYPFHTIFIMTGKNADKVLKDIAAFLYIEPIELEWAFISDQPT